MREQYVWSAGTPVLALGFQSNFPNEGEIERGWVSAAAGRLLEMYRPGLPLLMENGPMSTNLPARGWECQSIFRCGGRGWAVGKTDKEYSDFIHDSWKRAFMIRTEKDEETHLGARCFIVLQSEAGFPELAGRASTSLVERLEAMEAPRFHDLVPLTSEIAFNVSWQMGGYYGWSLAHLDERGEPLRHCGKSSDCPGRHRLKL